MLRALLLVVLFLPAASACDLQGGAEDRMEFVVYDSAARKTQTLDVTVGAPSRCLDPMAVAITGDRIVWLEGHTLHVLAVGGAGKTYALPAADYDDADLVGDIAYTLAGAKFGRVDLGTGIFTQLDLILGTEPAHRFLQEGTAWADHTPTQRQSGDADRFWAYDFESATAFASRTSLQDIGLSGGNATLLAANQRYMLVTLQPEDTKYGTQRWMHDLTLNRLIRFNATWQNPILDGDRFYARAPTGWKGFDINPIHWIEIPVDIRLDRVDAADGSRFVAAQFVDLPAPPPTSSATTSSAETVTVTVTPPRQNAPGLAVSALLVVVALALLAAKRR